MVVGMCADLFDSGSKVAVAVAVTNGRVHNNWRENNFTAIVFSLFQFFVYFIFLRSGIHILYAKSKSPKFL